MSDTRVILPKIRTVSTTQTTGELSLRYIPRSTPAPDVDTRSLLPSPGPASVVPRPGPDTLVEPIDIGTGLPLSEAIRSAAEWARRADQERLAAAIEENDRDERLLDISHTYRRELACFPV